MLVFSCGYIVFLAVDGLDIASGLSSIVKTIDFLLWNIQQPGCQYDGCGASCQKCADTVKVRVMRKTCVIRPAGQADNIITAAAVDQGVVR